MLPSTPCISYDGGYVDLPEGLMLQRLNKQQRRIYRAYSTWCSICISSYGNNPTWQRWSAAARVMDLQQLVAEEKDPQGEVNKGHVSVWGQKPNSDWIFGDFWELFSSFRGLYKNLDANEEQWGLRFATCSQSRRRAAVEVRIEHEVRRVDGAVAVAVAVTDDRHWLWVWFNFALLPFCVKPRDSFIYKMKLKD